MVMPVPQGCGHGRSGAAGRKCEHGQPISKTFHSTLARPFIDFVGRTGAASARHTSIDLKLRHGQTTDDTMATQTLHGACACGRNRYVVEIPAHQVDQAEVRYDNTSASRTSLCGAYRLPN
jgi:hypothetical protein